MKTNKNGVSYRKNNAAANDWDENHLRKMCEDFGFTCEFYGVTIFINTGIGKWRFDANPGSRSIKLFHYNMFRRSWNKRKFADDYHAHEKKYSSPAEAIKYIYAHDRHGYAYMRYSKEEKRMYAQSRAVALA